jgi:glyoxylase-like metal-dependent hydrolase (beta-lactamase superfamily II)
MRRVHGTLRLCTLLRISNVWLLEFEGNCFLVDAGHLVERPLLMAELFAAGIRHRGDLTAILLTHRHSDHAGNAAWLRERYGAAILCHPDDAAVLDGTRNAAPLSGRCGPLWAEILCRIEDRLPASCSVDGTYRDGRWQWGFDVVPVPGHTEGSCLLYHEPSATLFSGDAILAGPPPLRAIEWISLADPAFSEDAARCHANVRSFLRTMPPDEWLCSGHGPAVARNVKKKLLALGPQKAD